MSPMELNRKTTVLVGNNRFTSIVFFDTIQNTVLMFHLQRELAEMRFGLFDEGVGQLT